MKARYFLAVAVVAAQFCIAEPVSVVEAELEAGDVTCTCDGCSSINETQ